MQAHQLPPFLLKLDSALHRLDLRLDAIEQRQERVEVKLDRLLHLLLPPTLPPTVKLEQRGERQLEEQKQEGVQLRLSPQVVGVLEPVLQRMEVQRGRWEELYFFPEMRETNFHEKVDGRSNLLLLMELQNGEVVGAFTELGFDKPKLIPRENPRCFLFNAGRSRFLFAHKINKTHSYDPNYLIFGNWEIKLKAGEDFLQSKLGSKGDCFALTDFASSSLFKGDASDWLLGYPRDSERIPLRSYSLYTLSGAE